MSFTLRNTLVIASLLLISNVHSEQNNINSVLDSNNSSCISTNSGGKSSYWEIWHSDELNQAQSEVKALGSSEAVLYKLRDLINDNQKIGEISAAFEKEGASGQIAVFGNVYDSIFSTELLRYIINEKKNITINADDVKLFNSTINNLTDQNRNKATLIVSKIINILNQQTVKDKSLQSVYRHNHDYVLARAISGQTDIYHTHGAPISVAYEFLVSFIYKYFNTANADPKRGLEIINTILGDEKTDCNDFNKVKEILKNDVEYDKYYNNVLEKRIQNIPSDIVNESERKELLNKYTINELTNNKDLMMVAFNKARQYGHKFQLQKLLPYVVFITNKLFTESSR